MRRAERERFTTGATAFGRAGEIMKAMDAACEWPRGEGNRFRVMDMMAEAVEILDGLRDPIASEMVRRRIAKVQDAHGLMELLPTRGFEGDGT